MSIGSGSRAADVVDAAVAHVLHAIHGHSLRVDADSELAVEIDPRLASVALSHLLENASLYSPPEKEIVVHARVERDGLHISVTDNGPGLDPSELDHLFERFYRGRTGRQSIVRDRHGAFDYPGTARRGRRAGLGGERP